MAPAEGAARAEHLTAAEGAEEDQLVRGRDVEELAVHLLLVDNQRVRDAAGDRVGRVDRPDQLAVVGGAPPERARRPHQGREDLGPMSRVQDDQAHAGEHVALHPPDDLVPDLVVSRVPPPGEDIGLLQHLVGQAVVGVVEGCRTDDAPVAEVLGDRLRDGRVHPVGVDPRDGLVDPLVAVLAPDGDPDLDGAVGSQGDLLLVRGRRGGPSRRNGRQRRERAGDVPRGGRRADAAHRSERSRRARR